METALNIGEKQGFKNPPPPHYRKKFNFSRWIGFLGKTWRTSVYKVSTTKNFTINVHYSFSKITPLGPLEGYI